jgi:hypothetical protein
MNLPEEWKLIDKNGNRTAAMKEHSSAVIAFLKASPDIVRMHL